MSKTVLLVEDDAAIAKVVEAALGEEGFAVEVCASIARRDRLLETRGFDVMLSDVLLEDGDGLASMARVRELAPDMPVIVLSAQNTLDTAVRASDNSVFEYFPKPFDIDALIQAVRDAVAVVARARTPADEPDEQLPLIGRSPAMQAVYRMITRVLKNNLTVLITGESGTGKELVAEAIHQLGIRKSGPFVAVNMAAIPHDLLESELFGHEKGAFTGAFSQAIGKFEQAHGGTLFLDEIGDMPAAAQTRLLRALQTSRIRRVGGRQEIGVDVRILAATNRNLPDLIGTGGFREDLYYRLNVVPIELPPLRDRIEDIGPLVRHFLTEAAAEGLPERAILDAAIERLAQRDWPGNIRELRNVVFRLALLARGEVIDPDCIAENIAAVERPAGAGGAADLDAAFSAWYERVGPADGAIYHSALADFERPMFVRILQETGGNQLRAAQRLGINRNTLRKRLADLDIELADFAKRR